MLKVALATVASVALALALLVAYGLSERGLPFIVARIVGQTGGRVTVEAPSGSVGGTMRFGRITWRGADATVTAEDVVVDWNPGALWSRRLSIRGLGARHVDISIKPSTGATPPPTDLRLPLSVAIERLAVAELDWRAGPRAGHVSGLEFGYAGDATAHRIRELRLVSEFGKLAGNLELGAKAPLNIAGNAMISGDSALAGASISAQLGGTLAQIAITARGTWREAALALRATATPFAEAPFATAIADLGGVDAASLDASLPHTRAHVHLDARPQGAGIAGVVDALNEEPGPIDADRFPVASLTSRFAFENGTLVLDAIDAALPGGGGARGDGRVIVASAARSAQFALTVRDLDLARVHTKLVATHLSGRIVADADAARQTLEGDVRDRDLTLAFHAVIAGERLEVTRFRAGTAAGALAGSAKVALGGANDFSLDATLQRLDPARLAALPSGALNGTVKAAGVLRPKWRATANVAIAQGSRIEGVAVSGAANGTIAAGGMLRDATVDLALASGRVHASGSAGTAGDRLAFDVDAPRIAEIESLLPHRWPRPATGEVHATGTLAVVAGGASGDVVVRARSLRLGDYAAATLDARASIAAAPTASHTGLADRMISADIAATELVMPQHAFAAVHAVAAGTSSRHRVTLAARGRDIDATLAADGALQDIEQWSQAKWTGTLTAFENRGAVPVKLRAPAALAFAADSVRLTGAHLDLAGGRADIDEFGWNHGRIATRGAFTGVALAHAASLAGQSLPLESTLVVGGDWTIAAAPRLTGRFSVHRESGDVFAESGPGSGSAASERRGFGITSLAIDGTLDNDALDARATFASERAGTASGTVAIGTVSGSGGGRIDKAAPLRLALRAELASLAVFQPWIGTDAAINGRAALDVTAGGTVGTPLWSGTVTGDAVRIDAPQYGLQLTDGRLRAHLESTGIALDEVRFAGGDGYFTAKGLIALPGAKSTARTQVAWSASRFRVANRPDLRLVVNGDGQFAIENQRLALAGNVAVVEGHVEYDPTPTGKLAADIVIKGQAPATRRGAARATPLALDVDVDLGSALTFAGEGLETGLAGRIRITTAADGTLQGRGTIRAVNGTYFAFGQKLTIDRGRVIFDGVLDNPALDVVALRKNLPVEAGVQLNGTVRLPQVRITSNPPVPENEALAWLITGQGLNSSGRADYAAISAASAALLGRNGKPFTAEIAQRFGLDDISLQSAGTSGAQGTASQVVVLGKRISNRLSLGYEQGLSLATSALRLEYALSRQVTLRAEAGSVSGVAIVYRRNFR
jgi:translocation and assembly module TamB